MALKNVRSVTIDSAILLAFGTGLLFFWGSGVRGWRLAFLGVPRGVVPELTLQDYLLNGGLVLVVLLAFVALVETVLLNGGGTSLLRTARRRMSLGELVMCALVLLIVSEAVVYLVAYFNIQNTPHYQVVKFVSKSNQAITSVDNMYFVSRTDDQTVFVDRWAKNGAAVIVLDNDEIVELVLKARD